MNKTAFRRIRLTIWICALVFLADRVTKVLAKSLEKPIELIPGVIGLRYTENTGIAFGLFSGVSILVGVLTILFLTAVLFSICRLRLTTPTWVCVMMILGGALGNALDRIFLGCVPDMVEILLFQWGIFNVADAAVVIGICLLLIRIMTHPEEWKEDHGQSGEDDQNKR